ncbi:MAG: DUF3858 domain-containing protein [Flavobacterium sp.]|jgi:hypothetical protein|uniref:DUF3858 domain-containing protein n=1 Tax=Flavobacterium sp. TaxID=239 RepID=UPI003BA5AFD9
MKNLVNLIAFFFFLFSTAQEFKLEKITLADLEQKEHETDKNANAAILFKRQYVYYEYDENKGFFQVKDIFYRIKIYNQDGFVYAEGSEYLYNNGNTRETISRVDGVTYSIENGKIIETKLKKDQVFENKVNENQTEVKFTMPNLKAGCIIEYKYTVTSPFNQNIDEIQCQYEIPLEFIDIRISIPQYYVFRPNIKGYYPLNLKNYSKEGKISSTGFNRINEGYGIRSQVYKDDFTFVNNVYEIVAKEVPPLKDEPFITNINNYRSSFSMELQSRQFPGESFKNYSQTWNDVANSIFLREDFGKELKKSGYFENDLNSFLNGVTSDQEKLVKILEFCKQKVKWNEKNGFTCNYGVKEAYKLGSGNTAEVNLNLINMLNASGFDANPILVSTRKHGIPLFPTRDGFNYVVASVTLSNGIVLLDATDPFSTVNMLPERALNWKGRLIKKNGENEEISLFVTAPSQDNGFVSFTLDSNAKLTGKFRRQLTNYKAKRFRENFIGKSKENWLDELENNYKNLSLDNYEVTNDKEIYQPINETYSFSADQSADIVGNSILFKPLFFQTTKSNPFVSETRAFPIDFIYPTKSKYSYTINIPEGYTIETIPTSINIGLPDNMGSYKYVIQKAEKSIQIMVQYEILVSFIAQTEYEAVKDFFKQIIEKENEQVILKKL